MGAMASCTPIVTPKHRDHGALQRKSRNSRHSSNDKQRLVQTFLGPGYHCDTAAAVRGAHVRGVFTTP